MTTHIGFYMDHKYVEKNREKYQIPLNLTPVLTLHYAPIEFEEQVQEMHKLHAENRGCKNPQCNDHDSFDLCDNCNANDLQMSAVVSKIGYENWKTEKLEVGLYDEFEFTFNNGETVKIIGDEILIWQ